MRLIPVKAVKQFFNGFYYDENSLIGVDLITGCSEEKSFCLAFSEALNLGKAEVRIAKDRRLVLEFKGEGEGTRTFKMTEEQAKMIEGCFLDPNYKRRVSFLNGGYNALAIRFIKSGCTKQSLITKTREELILS